jgi:hypothetical protein
MSATFARSNDDPTHAQLFQFYARPAAKAVRNVIYGNRAALKRFQNNFINCHGGRPCFAAPHTPQEQRPLLGVQPLELAEDAVDRVRGQLGHGAATISKRV